MEYGVIEGSLHDQQERLERLFRYAQIGQCVSSVTHDVNNYLGAIMAYAELVAMDNNLPDESARMIAEILTAVRKASNLINNLTDVARKERPDVRVIEPRQFVERVLDLRRFDARSNQIAIEANYSDDPRTFAIDLPKLELALLYVLTNAVEAVADTPQPRKIHVDVTGNEEYVEIAIRDSGAPIPEELHGPMFDPFCTTKGGLHLGMGLTLARQLAVYHQGTLEYDPARGFVFHIPRSAVTHDRD